MKNTIPLKYAHISVSDFTNEQVEGLLLVKVRSNLWLITDKDGGYLAHEKTKKSALVRIHVLVKDLAEKVVTTTKKAVDSTKTATKKAHREAKRLVTGNIMGFRFGQKISSETVRQYVKKSWKGVFKLVEADIENGYWGGVIEHVKTGKQFQVVRIDYVINYIRPPKGSETFEDVRKLMVAMGVAKA